MISVQRHAAAEQSTAPGAGLGSWRAAHLSAAAAARHTVHTLINATLTHTGCFPHPPPPTLMLPHAVYQVLP